MKRNTFTLTLILMNLPVFSASQRRPNDKDAGGKGDEDLVELSQQQSCYYQSYNKCLTCNCNSTETSATVNLRLSYYLYDASNDIKQVHLQHCRELHVKLDLRQVDATSIPIHFRAIRKVYLDDIMFEPHYMDRQELQLIFYNVEELNFSNLRVPDTLKVDAVNIKEAVIRNSTFAHIPRMGFKVSKAKLLDIRDSKFTRVTLRSIVVEKTKAVTVVNNEMTMDALQVIYAKDGSHLMISCNRLLNQSPTPECSKITTEAPVTTTTTSTTPPLPKSNSMRIVPNGGNGEGGSDDGSSSSIPEIVGGVIGALLVITLVLLFLVLLLRQKRKREQQDSSKVLPQETTNVKVDVTPIKEIDKLKESDSLLSVEDDEEEVDLRSKVAPPIWLEDLHHNKMFNRQKSLLSEDRLSELATGQCDMEGYEVSLPNREQNNSTGHPPSYNVKPISSKEDDNSQDVDLNVTSTDQNLHSVTC